MEYLSEEVFENEPIDAAFAITGSAGFKSSNIKQMAYDNTKNKLYIEFKSGGVYEYNNVQDALWKGLKRAPSKGHYFYVNIRNYPNIYSYRKITKFPAVDKTYYQGEKK